MKRSPKENELLNSLGPSSFSAQGFLGQDQRHFEEIIAADARAIRKLGVSREFLADILEKIFLAAEKGMEDPVRITGDVQARYISCRGRIPSPFPAEGTFDKSLVEVFTDQGSLLFYVNRLSIHLIRCHGFFQGRGSFFRVEPEQIALLAREII